MIPLLRKVRKSDENYKYGMKLEIVLKDHRHQFRKFKPAIKQWYKYIRKSWKNHLKLNYGNS